MDMPQSAMASIDRVIHVLETQPGQFIDVTRQTIGLPGVPRTRNYSDAELEQLNNGFVRILLEAVRNEEPKARSVFMDHAIPSFVLAGETALGIVHFTVSYLVLFGSALAATVPSEQRADVLAWFSEFSGGYVTEIYQAALGASSGNEA
jgi:hypothetical protein